jgi:Flp pilus assembly protein TadD
MPKLPPLAEQARAEDSAETAAGNQMFYDNSRGLEPTPSATAGKISVDELQHPLSRKGESLIRQAQNFVAMGDHDKAISELRLALKERSAIPYADSLLGVEYLKTNQVPAAIDALEQAVKLMPRSVPNHSNLGYAFFLMGYLERGEQEVRRALDLDRNNEKTRRVLSLITHARETGK